MTDERTKLVGEGYDAMVDTWESWSQQIEDDPRHAWTSDLAARLPDGARVLELGCGGGTRETQELASRFELTGIDLSARQLERARERIPEAWFLHDDFTAAAFDPRSFDAVVSFSSFAPAINSQLVVDAGFVVERDEVIAITEPEGPAPFQWIPARR